MFTTDHVAIPEPMLGWLRDVGYDGRGAHITSELAGNNDCGWLISHPTQQRCAGRGRPNRELLGGPSRAP